VFICDGHQVKAAVEIDRIYDEELTLAINMELLLPTIAFYREEEQMEVEDEAGPLIEHAYCSLKSRVKVGLLRERDLRRAELARVKIGNLQLKRLLQLSQIRCSKVKKRLAMFEEAFVRMHSELLFVAYVGVNNDSITFDSGAADIAATLRLKGYSFTAHKIVYYS
jgi:hypothetical protein